MPTIISIEGNIGSGKSTFVKILKEYIDENYHQMAYFLEEPVSTWQNINSEDGKNIIECFYANQEKYSFSFQMLAYISRLALLQEAIQKGYEYIFTERCVFTDKNVFAKMLFDSGKIDKINYEIYNKWFNHFLGDISDYKYIYIKTDPNIAHERVTKRARSGEEIPLDYLIDCSRYHDNWLENIDSTKLYILDGDSNKNYCYKDYLDWINIATNLIVTKKTNKFENINLSNIEMVI